MKYSKEDFIQKYKDLKQRLGKQPSSQEFYQETEIPAHQLKKIYPRDAYSSLVEECGDTPQSFASEKTGLENILIQWGQLVKKNNRLPVISEWDFNKCKPLATNIRKNYGINWSEIPHKFRDYAKEKDEWQDILLLIPIKEIINSQENATNDILREKPGYVYLLKVGKHFKIGRAEDLGGREYQLKIQLPEKPERIYAIETDDMVGIEKYWHNRFADKRKNGEWFELSNHDISAFKKRKFM
ncbi:MAG: GIY-YIG nuclease family protein [Flavobacteriales bacterium]